MSSSRYEALNSAFNGFTGLIPSIEAIFARYYGISDLIELPPTEVLDSIPDLVSYLNGIASYICGSEPVDPDDFCFSFPKLKIDPAFVRNFQECFDSDLIPSIVAIFAKRYGLELQPVNFAPVFSDFFELVDYLTDMIKAVCGINDVEYSSQKTIRKPTHAQMTDKPSRGTVCEKRRKAAQKKHQVICSNEIVSKKVEKAQRDLNSPSKQSEYEKLLKKSKDISKIAAKYSKDIEDIKDTEVHTFKADASVLSTNLPLSSKKAVETARRQRGKNRTLITESPKETTSKVTRQEHYYIPLVTFNRINGLFTI